MVLVQKKLSNYLKHSIQILLLQSSISKVTNEYVRFDSHSIQKIKLVMKERSV
jgi:hypothetical protein